MDQPNPTEAADRPSAESTSPAPEPPEDGPTPDDAPTIPAQPDPRPARRPPSLSPRCGRQVRGLRFALGCAVAIAVGVILTAIDIQSGRILDREGHGWSFGCCSGRTSSAG